MDNQWILAALTGEQLQLLKQTEQTLGSNVKYLLAYQQAGASPDKPITGPRQQHIAPLNDKQLANLQKLEKQLHAVVIAYQ